MKNYALLVLAVICSISTYAQLIPAPTTLKSNQGHFILDAQTGMILSGLQANQSSKLTDYLINRIEDETGVQISNKKNKNKNIRFEILSPAQKDLGEEGYLLTITSKDIKIAANDYKGLFYGVQSLLQYVIANNVQPRSNFQT